MARAIWLPGGGGADLDVVTADAGDVLAGKVIVGPDGEPLTGTLALSGNASDGQVLSGQTYYNTDAKTKRTGTMPNRGAVNQSLAINGSYTIPAGFHNGSGKVTQSVKTKGAQTYTPGTTNQTIAAGQYLTGAQTIKGDPNLKSENIREGVTIFGKKGTVIEYKSPAIVSSLGGTTVLNGIQGNFYDDYFRIFTSRTQVGYTIARLNNNNAVNLTGWNYLNMHYKGEKNHHSYMRAKMYLGFSKNSNLTALSFDANWEKTMVLGSNGLDEGDLKLDVRSLSGTYFLYAAIQTVAGYDDSPTPEFEGSTIRLSTQ